MTTSITGTTVAATNFTGSGAALTGMNIGVASMIRLNGSNGYGSTNTNIRRFVNTVVNQGTDITYTDSASLGATFTINASGVYSISASEEANGASVAGLSLNSTELSTGIVSMTRADVLSMSATSLNTPNVSTVTAYFVVGDVIRSHTQGSAAGIATRTYFTITRVS